MIVDSQPPATVWRARRRLLLIVAILVLPMLIAYALYFSGWRPQTTGNYGELVQPPRALPALTLRSSDASTLHTDALRGKWTLLMFADPDCRASCEAALDKMHRIVLAQGNKADRVRVALVVSDWPARDGLQRTVARYPGTLVLGGPVDVIRALTAAFALAKGTPPDSPYRMHLIDPLGNFMMSYPPDADAGRVRKDLTRLLRVSRVG